MALRTLLVWFIMVPGILFWWMTNGGCTTDMEFLFFDACLCEHVWNWSLTLYWIQHWARLFHGLIICMFYHKTNKNFVNSDISLSELLRGTDLYIPLVLSLLEPSIWWLQELSCGDIAHKKMESCSSQLEHSLWIEHLNRKLTLLDAVSGCTVDTNKSCLI